jgi:hypothetical protein
VNRPSYTTAAVRIASSRTSDHGAGSADHWPFHNNDAVRRRRRTAMQFV